MRANLRLKEPTYPWQCPYCRKPVGYVGRAFAWLLGAQFHGCNFSNVQDPTP